MLGPSICRECKAEIVWAATVNGKMQPLNAAPDPEGNIVLTANYRQTNRGVLRECRVLTKAERAPGLFDDEQERFMPHHATCPHADRFRHPKAS